MDTGSWRIDSQGLPRASAIQRLEVPSYRFRRRQSRRVCPQIVCFSYSTTCATFMRLLLPPETPHQRTSLCRLVTLLLPRICIFAGNSRWASLPTTCSLAPRRADRDILPRLHTSPVLVSHAAGSNRIGLICHGVHAVSNCPSGLELLPPVGLIRQHSCSEEARSNSTHLGVHRLLSM